MPREGRLEGAASWCGRQTKVTSVRLASAAAFVISGGTGGRRSGSAGIERLASRPASESEPTA